MFIQRHLTLFFLLIYTYWSNAQNEFDQYQEAFDKVELYSIENEVDLGILELETVLQKAEKNGNSKLLIAVYHKIAELYLENKNIESATFYLSRTRLMLSQNLYPFANSYQKYLPLECILETFRILQHKSVI